MGKSKKIGVVSTNRAERGLLEPVIRRIKESKELELQFFDYTGKGFIDAYIDMREELITDGIDLMIIPADRQEMLGAAIACFYLNIPIAHFLAGCSGSMVMDEVVRDCISKMSYIMFTQSEEDRQRLIKMGEDKWRIHNVGMTQFDDIDDIIDESYRPNFEYSIVLYHPDYMDEYQIYRDWKEIIKLIKNDEHVFILYPNFDKYHEIVKEQIHRLENNRIGIYVIKDSLPRGQFLCLLKYTNKFIGNSSSLVYEAPYFGIKTINIGYRNKYRNIPKILIGGSDKIVKIIKDLEITVDKMRKCYAKELD